MSADQADSGTQVPLNDRARTGWAAGARVSSSGSAGTLPMTDEEKEQAAARERPFALGFAAPRT